MTTFQIWFKLLSLSVITSFFLLEYFRHNGLTQEWVLFCGTMSGIGFGIWLGLILGNRYSVIKRQKLEKVDHNDV